MPILVLAGAIVLAAFLLSRRPGAAGPAGHDLVERLRADGEATRGLLARTEQTGAQLASLAGSFEESRRQEERSAESVLRIERLLAGSYSKGKAGENMLAAALGEFPADMVVRDLSVGGRVCEFALRLADGKLIPIDSKWPAADVVEELETETDPAVREQLRRRVERAVELKVKEVAAYIDPSLTSPIAFMALPDPVFVCCRKVHDTARRMGVTIAPYSSAVPLLLSIWNLHRAYARESNSDGLASATQQLAVCLQNLSGCIEGQLSRALTQAQNAVLNMRPLVASGQAILGVLSSGEEIEDELGGNDPSPIRSEAPGLREVL